MGILTETERGWMTAPPPNPANQRPEAVNEHIKGPAMAVEALYHALDLVMRYPDIRVYLGKQISDVADAALGGGKPEMYNEI